MGFKFEKLEVWNRALEYTDAIYLIAEALPSVERFDLRSQLTRAANSVALNIAEGSTGQTDLEQARFLSYAIRSLIETVGCLHLIHRREYLKDTTPLREAYRQAERLTRQLQAFRTTLTKGKEGHVREAPSAYDPDAQPPF